MITKRVLSEKRVENADYSIFCIGFSEDFEGYINCFKNSFNQCLPKALNEIISISSNDICFNEDLEKLNEWKLQQKVAELIGAQSNDVKEEIRNTYFDLFSNIISNYKPISALYYANELIEKEVEAAKELYGELKNKHINVIKGLFQRQTVLDSLIDESKFDFMGFSGTKRVENLDLRFDFGRDKFQRLEDISNPEVIDFISNYADICEMLKREKDDDLGWFLTKKYDNKVKQLAYEMNKGNNELNKKIKAFLNKKPTIISELEKDKEIVDAIRESMYDMRDGVLVYSIDDILDSESHQLLIFFRDFCHINCEKLGIFQDGLVKEVNEKFLPMLVKKAKSDGTYFNGYEFIYKEGVMNNISCKGILNAGELFSSNKLGNMCYGDFSLIKGVEGNLLGNALAEMVNHETNFSVLIANNEELKKIAIDLKKEKNISYKVIEISGVISDF